VVSERRSEVVEGVQTGRQSFVSTWRPRYSDPCLPVVDEGCDTGPHALADMQCLEWPRLSNARWNLKSRRVTRRPRSCGWAGGGGVMWDGGGCRNEAVISRSFRDVLCGVVGGT